MTKSSGARRVAAALAIAGGGTIGAGIATAAPAAASTPSRCATSQLAASVASQNSGGTAGAAHQTLELKNTSSASCSLYGYPGVSYVTGSSGRQVGAAATRATGVKVAVVLMPPGAVAEAALWEIDPGVLPGCDATATRGFRVYPPGQTAALFAAEPGRACANPADKDLQVQPVVPGPGASYLTSSSSSAPSYAVVNEQIAVPSGYNFDVRGEVAAAGTPIQAWQANRSDPAQQFSVVHAPGPAYSGVYQILYTPFGSLKNAEAQPPGYGRTQAVQAYDSNGEARFAISSVGDRNGTQFQLRDRAMTANAWQDVILGPGPGGHVLIEPTYGVPGQVPGNNAMAANDAAYGKNGSPIINWRADGEWNEEIYSHHL